MGSSYSYPLGHFPLHLHLQLKCTASIFDVYSQSTEKVLLQDDGSLSAQESPVNGGGVPYNGQDNSYNNNSVYNFHNNNNNVNMFQASDPYAMHDFEGYGGNKKEAYMTPIQGKQISPSQGCFTGKRIKYLKRNFIYLFLYFPLQRTCPRPGDW